MKKKGFIVLGLVLLFSCTIFGKVVATLSNINKPLKIIIDKTQLYVVEKNTVYIYSFKDFRFIKKFGRSGEGPGEFKLITSVISYKDNLLVNSEGKISFFKKNGDFINEKKIDSSIALRGLNLYPLKNGFVGNGTIIKDKNLYKTINLYDSDFNKILELNRMLGSSNNKIKLLPKSFFYQTYRNKIFVSSKTGLSINVLNEYGKELYKIKYPNYKKNIFDKNTIMEKLKKKNKFKYEMLKNRLEFPEFYPEILNCFISDEKVYIATWKWKDNKIEFFVFAIRGKFLKRVYIPLFFKDEIFPRPYPSLAINNNHIYQLVENEDTEEWELHKNLIK